MKKKNELKEYNDTTISEYKANATPDDNDFAYSIVTTNGKPKTLVWSFVSFVVSLISIALCWFGWVGAVVAVVGITLSIVARKFLGFFSKLSLIGLFGGIFGFVISGAFEIAKTINLF